jgi:hypothetical protein
MSTAAGSSTWVNSTTPASSNCSGARWRRCCQPPCRSRSGWSPSSRWPRAPRWWASTLAPSGSWSCTVAPGSPHEPWTTSRDTPDWPRGSTGPHAGCGSPRRSPAHGRPVRGGVPGGPATAATRRAGLGTARPARRKPCSVVSFCPPQPVFPVVPAATTTGQQSPPPATSFPSGTAHPGPLQKVTVVGATRWELDITELLADLRHPGLGSWTVGRLPQKRPIDFGATDPYPSRRRSSRQPVDRIGSTGSIHDIIFRRFRRFASSPSSLSLDVSRTPGPPSASIPSHRGHDDLPDRGYSRQPSPSSERQLFQFAPIGPLDAKPEQLPISEAGFDAASGSRRPCRRHRSREVRQQPQAPLLWTRRVLWTPASAAATGRSPMPPTIGNLRRINVVRHRG